MLPKSRLKQSLLNRAIFAKRTQFSIRRCSPMLFGSLCANPALRGALAEP